MCLHMAFTYITGTVIGESTKYSVEKCNSQQDQVHLARRTHFVDLVIHDICSQKIIPYFADLVIQNICSQKIMPYFFDKLSTSIRNFAQ